MSGTQQPMLSVKGLSVEFETPGARGLFEKPTVFQALSDISLSLGRGEVLGLIGESGSGKTTLGKAIIGLVQTSQGEMALNGKPLNIKDRLAVARQVQMVFQDPYSSLHPRQTIAQTLAEPFRIHRSLPRSQIGARVAVLLERVGLSSRHAQRYPLHFSGGQRQRIAIARAIANAPQILIADEPVSALDVSVQAQILNLLDDLRREQDMAMLFISHDLSVVRHLCQRIAVMYLGRIVETGPSAQLVKAPVHPYTRALMSAAPRVKARNRAQAKPIVLKGDVPSHAAIPTGCPFHTRCWMYAQKGCPSRCHNEVPALETLADGRQSACFFAGEVAQAETAA